MSFGYLSKYKAAGKTARFTLDTLPAIGGKHPVLIPQYAGPGNDAYTNAMAKAAWVSGLSESLVQKANNEILARILAEHVLTGWEDVYEDDGPENVRPAAFTVEAAAAFLIALAEAKPSTFTAFQRFVGREAPFIGDIAPPTVRAEDLGKG